MSEPNRHGSDDRCELEPVTCWPLIYGEAGVVVVGILISAALFAGDLLRPLRQVAETPPPPTREVEQPIVVIDRGADVGVPQARNDERIVKVVKSEPIREYHPLPPANSVAEKVEWTGPVTKGTKASKPKPKNYRRLNTADEPTLAEGLLKVSQELDLESVKGSAKKLIGAGNAHLGEKKVEKGKSSPAYPIKTLVDAREDLRGLPLLLGKACRTSTEQAAELLEVSRKVRRLQASSDRNARTTSQLHPSGSRGYRVELIDEELKKYLTDCFKDGRDHKLLIRPLEQMYQVETPGLRGELVRALATIKGKEATQAIARRAVFDLSEKGRETALEELKDRDLADARDVFLMAMRHPWEPAATHAAVALAELGDVKAIEPLKKLIDLPSPTAATKREGKWFQKELVRVNHLRNCLLCHAPSTDLKDTIAAPIPTPGEPLPELYSSERRRNNGTQFVRADVVYLRQEFSVMHQVAKPNKWPQVQRFDYLVRERELTNREVDELQNNDKKPKSYPQRDAVRWAISTLSAMKTEPKKK